MVIVFPIFDFLKTKDMRKLLTLSVFLCIATVSQAQSWFDLGLKGGWGLTWLANQNMLDDSEFNPRLTTGFTFGGKLGYNINDFHEITIDVMYSQLGQQYSFNVLDSVTNSSPLYEKSLYFNTLDFFLMYRHNKDGRYFEVGPQYSLIKKARGTNTYNEAADGNVADNLNPSYFAAAFGFGSYFIGTENFGITLGARFSYSFSDIISSKGSSINYPSNPRSYSSPKGIHPITAMLIMEFNLDFAYMAKARCKNKRKLILF